MKANMDYETLRNSMTVQDAARVLEETNCCGTMDIAKNVILKALEEQPSEDWNAVLDELNRIGRNAFKDDTDYDNLFDFISNLPNVKPQPSEDEKVIRIKKGTLKARTGRYVIYDVEWLKKHFNTTEAKIYGQPSEDCISRKAALDSLHRYFAEGFNEDRWWNSTHVLDAINKAPSIAPQPKEEEQPKTGHWVLSGGYWRCSECKEKALLKLDKATGGYREYEPVRSKYCPECGAKMQEVKK